MSLDYFPAGWLKTTVGNIAEVIAGGTPKASDLNNFAEAGDGVAWITPADLSRHNCKYITHGARDLSQTGYNNSSAKLMPAGTLLFSSRAPIGYVAIASCPISTNQGFKNFVFHSEIDPSYSYYYLRSIREVAESLGTGTTFKEISGTTAKTLPFVLPPLAEQREIADRLDNLLAQVDTLKGRLDALPGILKRFRQSVLAAAVSGKLTEEWRGTSSTTFYQSPVTIGLETDAAPKGWVWSKLDELATLESGHTPRKSIPEYWDDGDIHWISLQDIRSSHGTVIQDTKYKPTMLGIENSSARLLPAGTVCFSRDISVGYTTIMGHEMSTTQHFANWICGEELINNYLMYALMAAKDHLTTSGQGSTVKTIYMPALKKFHILLPPKVEQTEIVRRVEQLFAFADQVEQRVKEGQGRVNNLTQSILAKAFRGELTAEWREQHPELISGENSASALLARIQAERAAQAPVKRTRRKKASA